MTATLTITPARQYAPDARLFEVDCVHGTTSLVVLPAPVAENNPPDTFHARTAIARHFAEEHCRCTRQLRRRFGVGGGVRG